MTKAGNNLSNFSKGPNSPTYKCGLRITVPLPGLRVPREEARKKIDTQLRKGRELHDSTDRLLFSLESAEAEKSKWVKYTRDLLELIFDNPSMADEFDPRDGYVTIASSMSTREEIDLFRESMGGYILRLESIHERLGLVRETSESPRVIYLRPRRKEPPGRLDKPKLPSSVSHSVFISHSSEDEDVIRVVKQAFEELTLTPLFNEKYPSGGPPVEVIAQRIADSEALFVFFTFKSISGQTRDWIIFELGIAQAYGKPVFAWVQNFIQKEQLPRLLEQLTTYRTFEAQTNQGTLKLMNEVRNAAKDLPPSAQRE